MTLPERLEVDLNSCADLVAVVQGGFKRGGKPIPVDELAVQDSRFPLSRWDDLRKGYEEIFASLREQPVRSRGERDVHDVLWRVQSDLKSILMARVVVVRIGGELRKLFPASLHEMPVSCLLASPRVWRFEFVD